MSDENFKVTWTAGGDTVTEVWYPEDTMMYPEIINDPIYFELYDWEDYFGIYQQILAAELGFEVL